MKALINSIILVAIVAAYIFSTSLYVQGNLFAAYSLILGSIVSLIFWIQNVSLQLQKQGVSVKMPSKKTVVSFLVLAGIASVYTLSVSLYVQGNLFAAFSLVIGSIASLIFWIQGVSMQLQKQRA